MNKTRIAKKKIVSILSLLSSVVFVLAPFGVVAESPATPGVIITEVQTGANGSGSNEFVELYNPTDITVAVSGWQLRYANAGSETTTLVATIPEGVSMAPNTYYTFHGQNVSIDGAGQVYSPKLSAADKTVALFGVDATTCQLVVADAVAWAAPSSVTKGEGTPVPVPLSKTTAEKLVQRYRDNEGTYSDTNDNAYDFGLGTDGASGTPGMVNPLVLPSDPLLSPQGSASTVAPLPITGCVVPAPVVSPDPDPGPVPDPTTPPDPAPSPTPTPDPQPDPGPTIPPDGGSPPTPDPVPDPTQDSGPTSEPDPAQDPFPEPGDTPPPTQDAAPNAGLVAPLVTELLPDPAAPQTDAADEFVELYNPNDSSFDLSGYRLETGVTTTYRFTFPAGSIIAPHAYVAAFSADTSLSLTNSGGQARLLDATGQLLSQSDNYGVAKEAQAWALVDGVWQWTTRPTPNAANAPSPQVLTTVASTTTKTKTAKAAAVKTSKPKSTKLKAAATTKTPKTSKKQPVQDAVQQLATTDQRLPLHPGVLALVATFAVLYGAYEYRRDVANKLYQLRRNRAARAEARQSLKGR